MKQTIGIYEFKNAFLTSAYRFNFSNDALELLFDYFESIEQDTGTEMELDIVSISCDYSESPWQDLIDDYTIDVSDCETDNDRMEVVREYLSNNTIVIGETPDGFVYLQH